MPLEYYSCKPCDKIFNGKRPYEDHIVSANHQKKMNLKHMDYTVVDSSTRTTLVLPQQSSDPFVVIRRSGYYCNICNLLLNGPDPMKAHIVGSKHLKMKSKQPPNGGRHIGNVDVDNPKDSSDSSGNTLADVEGFGDKDRDPNSDPFIISRGSGYYCNICNLPLNGPEQMKAHIVGSKHIKMKSKHPLNGSGDVRNVDVSTTKMSDSPKDSSDLNVDVENALPDVKVFKVNDPIEF